MNEMIYILGGVNDDKYLDTNEAYDTNANSWSGKAAMPTARAGLGVTAVDGKVYAIGGLNRLNAYGFQNSLQTVEVYNPAVDIYTTEREYITSRSSLGVVNANGKIYAVGGFNGSAYLNTVEEYDGFRWRLKVGMPTARKGLGVTSVDGKIYAIGGFNGSYLNTVEEYNPATNTWSTKTGMPTAR